MYWYFNSFLIQEIDLRSPHPCSCCDATESVHCEWGDLLQQWFIIKVLTYQGMSAWAASVWAAPGCEQNVYFNAPLLRVCIHVPMWNALAGQGKQWKVKSESKSTLIKETCLFSLHAQFSQLRLVIRSYFNLLFGFCSHNSRVQFSKSKYETV